MVPGPTTPPAIVTRLVEKRRFMIPGDESPARTCEPSVWGIVPNVTNGAWVGGPVEAVLVTLGSPGMSGFAVAAPFCSP
jgi:hypothetical protein